MKKRLISMLMSMGIAFSIFGSNGMMASAKEDVTEVIADETTEVANLASESDAEANEVPEIVEVDRETVSVSDIQDENFRKYMNDTFAVDGVINVADVKKIDCFNKKISDMKEIRLFTYLEELRCSYNDLSSLDLRYNLRLKNVQCGENNISTLKLPEKKTELTRLDCQSNQLTSLDVSEHTNLEYLNCGNNDLGELDISKNVNLNELDCYGCGLSELDVTNCPKLLCLWCGNNNNLKLIINENNAKIIDLSIPNTGITDYSFFDYLDLRDFNCASNGLDSLDISSQKKLASIDCSNNNLSELDVSSEKKLKEIYCSKNNLSELDVFNNLELLYLYCDSNKISNLNLNNNQLLAGLKCEDNMLTKLDLSKKFNLEFAYCDNNKLTKLDLSNNPKIKYVCCSDNKLNDINLLNCNNLEMLICPNSVLKSFDASGFPLLQRLDLSNNKLTSIKLENDNLTELNVYNNELKVLDVSKCPNINIIECGENHLPGIDLSDRGYACRVNGAYQKVFLQDLSATEGKIDLSKRGDMSCNPISKVEGGHIEDSILIADGEQVYLEYAMPNGWFDVTVALQNVPQLKAATIKTNGVNVSWDSIDWAAYYNVYRKEPGGSWSAIAKGIDALQYLDKTAESGKTYYYTVRALNENKSTYVGDYNRTGIKTKYIAAPKLSKVEAAVDGVKVSFGAVTGAVNYSIHRKEGSGSWKKIGTTTGTSYVDKTAVKGKTYTYTVRCISKDGSKYESAYNTKGLTLKYLATPKLTKVAKVSTGVKVTFGAVSGASQYRIYRKDGSGSWKSIGTITGTSYTDKTAVKGKKYTYTVRCISADGKTYESYYNTTGLSITYK